MDRIIKSKIFDTIQDINEFVKNTPFIEVININRIYEDYEYINNHYRITCNHYELIYFEIVLKEM